MRRPLSLDYQSNLSVVDRWPYRLYHHPIRNHVLRVIEQEQRGRSEPLEILNVGCGLSQILPHIPGSFIYEGVDIDPRNIEACEKRFDRPNARFRLCEPFALHAADNTFDMVFATEVVEHVIEPERWLQELVRVIKPGGRVQLSTPNYGGLLLPLIEQTFLELVARFQGFTRRGIHPTPFNARKLRALLETGGGLQEVLVEKTWAGLALVVTGRKPRR